MYKHAPVGYRCPFCLLIQGDDEGMNQQADIFYRDPLVMACVAPVWWPNNAGHALIIPTAHYEHLYDLPRRYGHAVQDATQLIAIALKAAYRCEGVFTRQHNEPAGGQDVWHYHLHVFPRYQGDDLYRSHRSLDEAPRAQRAEYAARLRAFLVERTASRAHEVETE